jgi:hypothetical protein
MDVWQAGAEATIFKITQTGSIMCAGNRPLLRVGAYIIVRRYTYDRLGEIMNRARRAGVIPFDAICDDGITLVEPVAWKDADELIDTFLVRAEQFRLDRQLGQPTRLIIAVEAAGMVPQIERVADPFGIPVHSSGGFDSLTAKHDLANTLGRYPSVEVLHLGDHDPRGVHMFSSIMEDVQALVRDMGLPGVVWFTRLAVTPEQITALNLPTAPPKRCCGRSRTSAARSCLSFRRCCDSAVSEARCHKLPVGRPASDDLGALPRARLLADDPEALAFFDDLIPSDDGKKRGLVALRLCLVIEGF